MTDPTAIEVPAPKPERSPSEFITEVLAYHGITQSDLAKILGISKQRVFYWVSGTHKPSKEYVNQIVEWTETEDALKQRQIVERYQEVLKKMKERMNNS